MDFHPPTFWSLKSEYGRLTQMLTQTTPDNASSVILAAAWALMWNGIVAFFAAVEGQPSQKKTSSDKGAHE